MHEARVAPRPATRFTRTNLTVACVYRSGGSVYTSHYVAVLRDMVARHLTVPHRFVCLSDADVPCERIPLVTTWRGFYSKIELYRPGLFTGPVLYFDLDTVIHGNIDELARLAVEVPFGCVSDPLGGHMNSSVVSFTTDCSFIFERFRSVGNLDRRIRHHAWFALRRVGLGGRLKWGSSFGDQGFAEMCLADAGIEITHLDRRLHYCFSTYNFTADAQQEPKGSVCLMMNRPKPHEITTGWIPAHWRTTSNAVAQGQGGSEAQAPARSQHALNS